MTGSSPYMTVADVAREIDMTPDGVRKLIRSGKLKALRLSERKIVVPRAAFAAYQRRLSGETRARFEAPPIADAAAMAAQFERTTGLAPEQWLAAWKREEIEDSVDNMVLMV